jgi:hypothetical protein
LPLDELRERLALEELHDVVEEARRLSRAVELHDVRALESADDAGLAQEALARRRALLAAEDFEGDLGAARALDGPVDGAHAAPAELGEDRVAGDLDARGGSPRPRLPARSNLEKRGVRAADVLELAAPLVVSSQELLDAARIAGREDLEEFLFERIVHDPRYLPSLADSLPWLDYARRRGRIPA